MDTPPPNYNVPPETPAAGQTTVEVLPLPTEDSRFIITVDTQGTYRVFDDYWVTSGIYAGDTPYWHCTGPVHLTDTLERARECIAAHFPSSSVPNNALQRTATGEELSSASHIHSAGSRR